MTVINKSITANSIMNILTCPTDEMPGELVNNLFLISEIAKHEKE